MSLPKTMEKQWENADLCGTKQNIYRSKGFDESCPKNITFIEFEPRCQKLWAFMSSFGHVTWPWLQISKIFIFHLILYIKS